MTIKKEALAAERYHKGNITLEDAAQMAGLSIKDFMSFLKDPKSLTIVVAQ